MMRVRAWDLASLLARLGSGISTPDGDVAEWLKAAVC
jgi:hypothetical protein